MRGKSELVAALADLLMRIANTLHRLNGTEKRALFFLFAEVSAGSGHGAQVSSDLPNTINRFLQQEDMLTLDRLSDYYDQNFGRSFGVLIEEPRIITRAVFVIDWQGALRHVEVVLEITQQPDYDVAISVLRTLVVSAPGAIAS